MERLDSLVELYGTAECPFTTEMREHLQWDGVMFIEYDVETDDEARRRLLAITGGQRMVPVLVEGGRVAEVGWRGRGCFIDTHAQRP